MISQDDTIFGKKETEAAVTQEVQPVYLHTQQRTVQITQTCAAAKASKQLEFICQTACGLAVKISTPLRVLFFPVDICAISKQKLVTQVNTVVLQSKSFEIIYRINFSRRGSSIVNTTLEQIFFVHTYIFDEIIEFNKGQGHYYFEAFYYMQFLFLKALVIR